MTKTLKVMRMIIKTLNVMRMIIMTVYTSRRDRDDGGFWGEG